MPCLSAGSQSSGSFSVFTVAFISEEVYGVGDTTTDSVKHSQRPFDNVLKVYLYSLRKLFFSSNKQNLGLFKI